MDMNLLKYRAFVATVEDGSFTRAAERLHYSQSGISILPELILKRVPYRIAIRELDVPALRTIAFCLRDRKNASLAVKRFLEYLDFREEKTAQPCGKTREN